MKQPNMAGAIQAQQGAKIKTKRACLEAHFWSDNSKALSEFLNSTFNVNFFCHPINIWKISTSSFYIGKFSSDKRKKSQGGKVKKWKIQPCYF